MFQRLKEKLIENKNWIVGVLFLIIVLTLVIFIVNIAGDNFSLKKENKEYKNKLKELDIQFNNLQTEKVKAIETAEYYKHISDSLGLLQNNIHTQTTKIIYKTNEEINNIDNLTVDSNVILFRKLAEEYIRYSSDKDSL